MAKVSPETKLENDCRHNTLLKHLAVWTMPVEGLFFFGLIMGWPSLTEVLKEEGVYDELCSIDKDDTLVCTERDQILSNAGILGYISTLVSVLPLGFIFDHYGTFVTRSICTLLMSLGLLMIMFIPEFNWLIFPGVLFLTAGSYSLLVTNNSLSSLFPKLTAFILVLSECTYAVSSICFRLWQILYGMGFSFKKIVLLNLSFTSIQWLRTFFLMPVGWTDSKIAPFYSSPFYTKSLLPKNEINERRIKRLNARNHTNYQYSVKPYILTAEFWLFLAWVSVGNMFVGFIAFTWNQYTEFVTEDYIDYIALYGNLSWMAAVVGVLAGFVVDWVSTKLPYPVFDSKVLVVLCLAIVNNLLGIGVHACQFVKMERTISTALFIFQFNRALVFCSCSIYVKCHYPSQVYGSMMGIVFVSLGLTTSFVVGLVSVITEYGWKGYIWVMVASSCLLVATLSFPIYAFWKQLRKTKTLNELVINSY